MSRSGYGDDCDDHRDFAMWRGRIASASRGKRGQAFFVALGAAMDAMPDKSLIADELVKDGAYCALGVLGAARGVALEKLDVEDAEGTAEALGAAFDIASCLAQETVYMNDEAGMGSRDAEGKWQPETPQERWTRMRAWVAKQIRA